mgnify:CR=1 FL=1
MPKSNFKIDEITLVLIVAIIAMIVSINNEVNKPSEMEAEKITEIILDTPGMSFARCGVIDENKLEEIKNINYDDFKKSLDAKNDFCIYIEDGNGSIILAKGSSKLNRDGLYCRE